MPQEAIDPSIREVGAVAVHKELDSPQNMKQAPHEDANSVVIQESMSSEEAVKREAEARTQQALEDDSGALRKKIETMTGTKASKKSIALSILGLIPFFNKFVDSASGVGNALTSLIQIDGVMSHAVQSASNSFQFLRLGSALVDFVRIPLIYVGAAVLKQKVPFTFSRNARLLYSTAAIGLAITAMAVPPAAPVILLVGALLSFGQSVVTLANLYHKRQETKDKLAQVEQEISIKKAKINPLIEALEELEKNAATSLGNGKELERIQRKIQDKKEEIKYQTDELQQLYDSKAQCQQQLEKLGTTAARDKTVGVGLAASALIGAGVALIFPPAGVAILAATAAVGFTYLAVRTFPMVKSFLGKIFSGVTKKSSEPSEPQDSEDLKPGLGQENKQAATATPTSTSIPNPPIGAMFQRDDLQREATYLKEQVKSFPVITEQPESTAPSEPVLTTENPPKPHDEPEAEEDTRPFLP